MIVTKRKHAPNPTPPKPKLVSWPQTLYSQSQSSYAIQGFSILFLSSGPSTLTMTKNLQPSKQNARMFLQEQKNGCSCASSNITQKYAIKIFKAPSSTQARSISIDNLHIYIPRNPPSKTNFSTTTPYPALGNDTYTHQTNLSTP